MQLVWLTFHGTAYTQMVGRCSSAFGHDVVSIYVCMNNVRHMHRNDASVGADYLEFPTENKVNKRWARKNTI